MADMPESEGRESSHSSSGSGMGMEEWVRDGHGRSEESPGSSQDAEEEEGEPEQELFFEESAEGKEFEG